MTCLYIKMSRVSIYHILLASFVALVVVLSTPVSGSLKYERTIAFSVERTSSMSESSNSRDIGGYNRQRTAYLNIGQVLNVNTGRFKAPLEGVYFFSYSFSSTIMGATTKIELLKLEDGRDTESETSQVIQTLSPTFPNPLDSASASVMVELKQNDEVYLRLGPGLLDASVERPLLFTGYMVYREGENLNGW